MILIKKIDRFKKIFYRKTFDKKISKYPEESAFLKIRSNGKKEKIP